MLNRCASTFVSLLKVISPFILLSLYTICTGAIILTVERNFYLAYINSSSTVPLPIICSWSIRDGAMWSAIHYVATLETTVGYGDIFPCSPWGQALSILIAMIGIPLMLVCLTRMGSSFEKAANRIWSLLVRPCRRKSEKNSKGSTEVAVEGDVPLLFGIFLCALWTLLCTIYFYYTMAPFYKERDYTFFTSLYFTSVSLLTIGLGDFSPLNYKLVLPTFIFISVGLAMVSMCISIVENKLSALFENAVKVIHKEYQQNLLADTPKEGISKMTVDSARASENVKNILRQQPGGKWFIGLMSKSKQNNLLTVYQNKAKMVTHSTQTNRKKRDQCWGTEDISEKRDFGCLARPAGSLRAHDYAVTHNLAGSQHHLVDHKDD